MSKIRQVWTLGTGGPEKLEVREGDRQNEVPSGHVSIRVHASGINFADLLIRHGIYPAAPKLPAVIGYEIGGEIDQVGAGVDLPIGLRVMAMTHFGGYSEQVVVPASEVIPIPDQLSYSAAAAIPVNYATAYAMLIHMANLLSHHTVLVHAVAGGVGQAALQIARWKGANVIGTASLAKHQRLQSLGVQNCLTYDDPDFIRKIKDATGGRGVDVILDGVGGKTTQQSFECLGSLGKLICFGVSTMVGGSRRNWWRIIKGWFSLPRFSPLTLMDQCRGVLGFNLGELEHHDRIRGEILRDVVAGTQDGRFEPVIDAEFDLADAAAAQQHVHDRKNFGKVILTTQGTSS